jgi:hypothetical protein
MKKAQHRFFTSMMAAISFDRHVARGCPGAFDSMITWTFPAQALRVNQGDRPSLSLKLA